MRLRATKTAGFTIALFAVLWIGSATTAGAQTEAQALLPQSFAGWARSSSSSFSPPPGPSAAAATEYGLASASHVAYVHGSSQLDVTLYRMKDPSGAYGEFTFLRTPDMLQANLTGFSAMSSDHALVLIGNLVIDIRGRDLPKLDANLKSLASAVAPHAEEGALPTLMNELPPKGLVARTEHYILGPAVLNQFFPLAMGDSLGFSNGAEAEVAKYRVGGRDMTLLIVDYPTPQSASSHLKALQQKFDINDSRKDSRLPPIYEKRTLTSLVFVAGAKSENQASGLLGHLQSSEVLTWNEPTFSLTQPNIGTIVVGTIIGTGLICMFALISGLAFGGVRLVVKRALPDKVFDRSQNLEILQLGLSSKPIKSEDFYSLRPQR